MVQGGVCGCECECEAYAQGTLIWLALGSGVLVG